MFQLIKNANINFIGRRKIFITISLILIGIGIVSLILHGGPRFGIDFEGGTLLQVKFQQPVEVSQIRSALATEGYSEAVIQSYGSNNEYIIRVKVPATAEAELNKIKKSLATLQGETGYEIRRVETVGPKIGKELRGDAVAAVLIAMLGIVIYISIRFQFRYAVAAIIALVHDVMITLGFFSVTDMEINLTVIAAFLFIVGYSLNDTIVVFDRIRENVKNMRREKFERIANISINETLNRTIITSTTTMLAVLSLLFFGGKVIRPFALALVVGLIVGTYSSIFIASPVVVAWDARSKKTKK